MDYSPVADLELKAWYSFAFAAEGYSVLANGVFFPIILQHMAAHSGVQHSNHSIPCITNEAYSCDVKFYNYFIDTSSAVFFATTISVLIQFVLFISLGAIADHGNHRKTFLIGFAAISALLGSFIIFATKDAIFLFIFANVFHGASFVFYYAWVPILTRFHPTVIESNNDPAIREQISNQISSHGFVVGYLAAVIQLIIAAVFALAVGSGTQWGVTAVYPLQIGVAFACLWQLITLLTYTNTHLKPRPGPPLPPGENYILYSLKSLRSTLSKAAQLKDLFTFLLGWFIFSDGIFTISTVAILYCQSELGVSQSGLIIAAIITPFAAAFGNRIWISIQHHYRWSTKDVLVRQSALYCLLPLYGLMGFLTPKGSIGIQAKWEIYVLAFYHGFLLGASQSSCRVLFSELLPIGHESEFFSLYEITDKGSAWIGPLIVGIIGELGDKRYCFWFLLIMLVMPVFIFSKVDVGRGRLDAIAFVGGKNGDEREEIPLMDRVTGTVEMTHLN
ncbi:autophagy-related protein 22-like protein [Globomyces pollinis-pini]|nr:autophagy-related protein 22-like protein [Globomyces pollinis-pini]